MRAEYTPKRAFLLPASYTGLMDEKFPPFLPQTGPWTHRHIWRTMFEPAAIQAISDVLAAVASRKPLPAR